MVAAIRRWIGTREEGEAVVIGKHTTWMAIPIITVLPIVALSAGHAMSQPSNPLQE